MIGINEKIKGKSAIDLLLLGLLLQRSRNAYELANFIEHNHLSRLVKISQPAVYKNCKRMYKSDLLDGKTVREGEAPEKVTYSVNKKGKKYFYQLMEHYSNEIKPFFFEHNSFLWCVESLDKEEGLRMLNNLQTSLVSLKDWMVSNEEYVSKNGTFGGKALVKQYRMILKTQVQWIQEIIEDYKLGS